MRNKQYLPIQIAFLLSLLILLLSSQLGLDAVRWIMIASFVVVGLFILYFIIAQFIRRLRQSIWLSLITNAVIVYIGFLVISLSRFKGLLEQMEWDVGMVALGLAVVAFGWGFFMQSKPRQQDQLVSVDSELADLNTRIQTVNKKLSELEGITDVFLNECHKLGRKIASTSRKRDDVTA